MLKGLASALVVLLLFGFLLGAALFRPIGLDPPRGPPVTPTPLDEAVSDSDPSVPPPGDGAPEGEVVSLEAEWQRLWEEQERLATEWQRLWDDQQRLDDRWENVHTGQASLTQAWEDLWAEQSRLAQDQGKLQAEQNELARAWTELEAQQDHLAQAWKELEAQQAHLDGEWERLKAELGRLEQERVRLQNVERNLAAKGEVLAQLESTLEGRMRWSVAALVVSGLLAVPSVLVLIALARQGWQMPDQGTRPEKPSRTWPDEWLVPSGRPESVSAAPSYSGNGRGKKSVGHRVP